MRVVPHPLEDIWECKGAAHLLLSRDFGFKTPFICSTKRPQLPEAPLPVEAGRWA
jgi:hypothetical protein